MNVLNTLLVEHDQNIFMLFLKVVLQLDVLKIKNKFPVLLFPPALEDIKSSMRMKQETLRNYLFKMARFIVYSFFVEHFAGQALLKSDCTARRQFLTRLCLLSTLYKAQLMVRWRTTSACFPRCGVMLLCGGKSPLDCHHKE